MKIPPVEGEEGDVTIPGNALVAGALHGVRSDGETRKAGDATGAAGDTFGVTFSARPIPRGGGGWFFRLVQRCIRLIY